MRHPLAWIGYSFVLLALAAGHAAAGEPAFARKTDVVYGRKHGTALTLDVFTPQANANGAGVIWVVSGGWFSAYNPDGWKAGSSPVPELLRRGYTVFAVVHGTQPKFTILEILDDMHRAVRFVRYHAKDYHIDPDHLGITGGSAGGHLSLMMGTDAVPGDPKAKDPVERVSSRVQAVACFFPPTDFLNWGKPGAVLDTVNMDSRFRAAVDFKELDSQKRVFQRITDEKKVREILGRISPITHVSADDAPTLIIHGDIDKLVPLQQSEIMVARLKEAGVPAKLIVKKDCGHGWITILKDTETLGDWFDQYLKDKPKASQ